MCVANCTTCRYDHSRIKLEQVLKGVQRSNLDAAIWSQGLRLVYVAIDTSNYRCPDVAWQA